MWLSYPLLLSQFSTIFFNADIPVTVDSSVSGSPGDSVWFVKGTANLGGIDRELAAATKLFSITKHCTLFSFLKFSPLSAN